MWGSYVHTYIVVAYVCLLIHSWLCHILHFEVFLAGPLHVRYFKRQDFLVASTANVVQVLWCAHSQTTVYACVYVCLCVFRTNWWMCVRKYSCRHWGLRGLSTRHWQPRNKSFRWGITPTPPQANDHTKCQTPLLTYLHTHTPKNKSHTFHMCWVCVCGYWLLSLVALVLQLGVIFVNYTFHLFKIQRRHSRETVY